MAYADKKKKAEYNRRWRERHPRYVTFYNREWRAKLKADTERVDEIVRERLVKLVNPGEP